MTSTYHTPGQQGIRAAKAEATQLTMSDLGINIGIYDGDDDRTNEASEYLAIPAPDGGIIDAAISIAQLEAEATPGAVLADVSILMTGKWTTLWSAEYNPSTKNWPWNI